MGWSVTGVLGRRRAVAQELKSEPPTPRVAEVVQFGLHLAGATLYQSLVYVTSARYMHKCARVGYIHV